MCKKDNGCPSGCNQSQQQCETIREERSSLKKQHHESRMTKLFSKSKQPHELRIKTTSWIKNDQTIFKVQEMVKILPRCTNYSKWSCIGSSCSWTIFKLFLTIWVATYLPEYKSTWVDQWSARTQCEAPKDVVSCSSCDCKPVKYFFLNIFGIFF